MIILLEEYGSLPGLYFYRHDLSGKEAGVQGALGRLL